MKSLKQLIDDKKPVDKNKYVSREFQDYGYRLAAELGDLAHKSLYIKLAKTYDRATLEMCKRFVMDSHADNRGALFMWKLKQLQKKL
jgi:Ca2+-dependent lipid-binding protein